MPRLRCHYVDCAYLEKGYCGAPSVELDPDEGCMTYTQFDEVPSEEDWVSEDIEDLWEEEEEGDLLGEDLDSDWLGSEET